MDRTEIMTRKKLLSRVSEQLTAILLLCSVCCGGVTTFGGGVSLQPSCVAFWRLDDALANDVVLDGSGNSNTGFLQGGDDTGDLSGASGNPPYLNLRLDLEIDDSDFVAFASQPPIPTEGTISVWVAPEDVANLDSFICANVETANTRRLYLYRRATQLRVRFGSENLVVVASPFVATTWIHIVLVWGGGNFTVYTNGTQLGAQGSYSNLVTVPGTFNIAAVVGNQTWDGLIDMKSVYNKQLNATERAFLYNGGIGDPLPVGYGTQRKGNSFHTFGGVRNYSIR